ncbi:phenoloxidase-activating factor 2-like [Thrips palmi]|uniref:Phenoloxidase-activating factor 2 n=1 Tax=Thrips palmi TaxID=161013 RepID=A0A6P8YIH2_THRPL|nr:phenoloxidase-activating factor 2-like [Thrips palmi]
MAATARLVAAAAVVAALAVVTPGTSAACVAAKDDAAPTPTDAELCELFGGASCPRTWTQRGGRAVRQAEDLNTDEICKIFGGPSCPADDDKVYEPCTCRGGSAGSAGCQCVPYYMCPGRLDDKGDEEDSLIDIRQQTRDNSTCDHYLHECCLPSGPPSAETAPNPSPSTQGPRDASTPAPPQLCGVRNRLGVGTRISGGLNDETNFGEIPWMVAVFRKRGDGAEYLCGGGLIAPNVVLTAAHCVINDVSGSSLLVRAGEWDSRTEAEVYKHQDRDVENVIIHPDYKRKTLHNNMGLLVLREPVRIGYHIGTICLPEQDQNFDFNTCLVSGWGKDKFGKDGVYQNILRLIEDLPVVPHAECQDKLRRTRLGAKFILHKTFMCAGGIQGRDACTGDGGSPLVCPMTQDDDSRYVYAGIVSWGIGCGTADVPGVYADVAMFRTWIEEALAPYNIQLCSS